MDSNTRREKKTETPLLTTEVQDEGSNPSIPIFFK